MPKREKEKPLHAIPVTTYAEFREYIQKFADGHFSFLMVIGSTSLGKTETIREVIPNSVVCDGALSVYQFFGKLSDHLDTPFVLDDLPTSFYRQPEAVAILKALTNSTASSPAGNKVRYQKASLPVDEQEVVTKSRVILLANSWASVDPNVRALEARGIILMFNPTNYEVHKAVAQWFRDREVFDFLYGLLPSMERNQMRLYALGATLKSAGMDWKSALLQIVCGDKSTQVFLHLQHVDFPSENKRCAEFAQRMNCSQRTYWRVKKRLEQTTDLIGPNIALQSALPRQQETQATDGPQFRIVGK